MTTANSSAKDEITDEELWDKVNSGEKKALEALYFRHYDDLYKYAIKMCRNHELTEDSIHDLFLKIWNQRNELSEVRGVKTYLWKSLRNTILSKLRKSQRRIKILSRSKEEIEPDVKLNVEDLIIADESHNQNLAELATAINELTPRQREILYLKFYHGMTYDEIEEIMSVSYQVARNYLCKAIGELREILD